MGRKDSLFTLAPDTREFARLLPRIKSEWPVHPWLGRLCNQFGRWNHASFGCKTSVTVGDTDLQVRVWGTFPNPWKKLFWALYYFTSFANLQGNNTVIYCFASRGKGWFFPHRGGGGGENAKPWNEINLLKCLTYDWYAFMQVTKTPKVIKCALPLVSLVSDGHLSATVRIVLTTTKWQVDVWFAAALYGCETEGSVAGDGTVK